jgi:hypothetical protein
MQQMRHHSRDREESCSLIDICISVGGECSEERRRNITITKIERLKRNACGYERECYSHIMKVEAYQDRFKNNSLGHVIRLWNWIFVASAFCDLTVLEFLAQLLHCTFILRRTMYRQSVWDWLRHHEGLWRDRRRVCWSRNPVAIC